MSALGDGAAADATRLGLQDQLSRLESLAVLASPAAVAERARDPKTPTSPRPIRNAIVAALFGLIVGIIAAFLRASTDRRLRDPREIQGHFDFPLLAHISQDALGHVAHAGAEPSEERGTQIEAFRILRSNLEFLRAGEGFTTIAVTSALPAEGKTTVAASLATVSAAAGRLTLLVECDLRRPTLASRLGIPSSPGLADYLTGAAEPGDILQRVSVMETGHVDQAMDEVAERDLICITAGSPVAHPTELLGSPAFAQFLDSVRAAYDVIILDTCPLLPVADTLQLLPLTDAIVFCVRSGQTTREQALAGRAALARFPPRPSGLVVTGVKSRDEAEYGYYSGDRYYASNR